jgi:chromosome segregation ATPase
MRQKVLVKMNEFFKSLVPYLPFIGTFVGVVMTAIVPLYLMRLQGQALKGQIDNLAQGIKSSKAIAAKDQITALETLERVANTTAEELEKSLQKSITMRNLLEQVSLQTTQLAQQNDIIILHVAKVDKLTKDLASAEIKLAELHAQLTAERAERQTAVAEIENLKSYSDEVIRKLTTRVKRLEEYIRENNLPVPNGTT